ncbi:hypothetical protein SCHPADRAFT_940659 [Schizopora paradoxa]|uniref:Uncharacterized protein n=1 Tax=Schizopora paradoxa TaxID=27342 RepID=A0A0H2RNA5_9AGAM|nr:hypothetical protein SCHPADRAFT_940659 [Schizopora paradoxa]
MTASWNISVDDNSFDPYSGARIFYGTVDEVATNGNGWNIGQDCPNCTAQPDPSMVFNRTWHDTSSSLTAGNIPMASFSFTGIAIYVMGISVSSSPETTKSLNNSRIFFRIDDEDAGSYFNTATVGSEVLYSYNVTFFAKENLPDGPHNITMLCGNGTTTSLCLLDRFIYTTEIAPNSTTVNHQTTSSSIQSTPGSSHGDVPTEVFAGIAAGLMFVLVLLLGAYFLRCRREKRSKSKQRIQVHDGLAELDYSDVSDADRSTMISLSFSQSDSTSRSSSPPRYSDAKPRALR